MMRGMDFESTGWAADETVCCYAAAVTPGVDRGAVATSGTADATGAVTFEDLTVGLSYVAIGQTSGRRARFGLLFPQNGLREEVTWDGTGVPVRSSRAQFTDWVTESADDDPAAAAIDGDTWTPPEA